MRPTIAAILVIAVFGNVIDKWEQFQYDFCKVEFVCWQGEPNWLGWIILGAAASFIIYTALNIWLGDEYE